MAKSSHRLLTLLSVLLRQDDAIAATESTLRNGDVVLMVLEHYVTLAVFTTPNWSGKGKWNREVSGLSPQTRGVKTGQDQRNEDFGRRIKRE